MDSYDQRRICVCRLATYVACYIIMAQLSSVYGFELIKVSGCGGALVATVCEMAYTVYVLLFSVTVYLS